MAVKEIVFQTRNGDLCVAIPCAYHGKENVDMGKLEGYSIGIMEVDGYAVYHPELAGGMTLFFNPKCLEFFENLGEL